MNKKERNAFYKTMLENYKKSIKDQRNFGFCSLIWELSPPENDDFYHIEDFEELMAYKPEVFYYWTGIKTSDSSQFWFLISDTESRIQILEKIIQETNEEV